MSDFNMDLKNPLTWLLAPLVAPFALMGGCDKGGKAASTDADTDTDTETETDCTPNAYQQCGDNGDISWFDSCDVEGEVADYCGDCETCVNTSDTTAECQVVTVTDAQAIAAGEGHACVVLSSGEVKGWGKNVGQQFGWGPPSSSITIDIEADLSPGAQEISASHSHTCALLTSGGIKCWGDNSSGQFGDETVEDSLWQAVTAGKSYTCAISDSEGAKCWGWNEFGQLGNGDYDNSSTPVDVSGLSSGVQAITAGTFHTCALLTSGGVQCWGSNYSGQLGDGTTNDSPIPVDVSGLSSNVKAISAGKGDDGSHSCAVLESGGVMCWGNNEYGQLGDGTTDDSLIPVDVAGLSSDVQAITAGYGHTCALLTSGGAKCWGANWNGQLGDGTTDDSTTPVDVSGLSSEVQAIECGSGFTCALFTTGGFQCWGGNSCGELGNGECDGSLTPVDVCVGDSFIGGCCEG